MRILLTGKDGQLGFELRRTLSVLGEVRALGRADCDLSDEQGLRDIVRAYQPDMIVNAAAYTAVDKAESDVALAHAINARAPQVLAEEARARNALLLHFSTDYVFDGLKDGAYLETDATNPQNVYGASKWAGEQAIQSVGGRYLIFRTSWVVGAHGGNFAKTILRLAAERDALKIVADQYGAPTSAALLADVSAQVLAQAQRASAGDFPYGLYHVSGAGETTWFDYAKYVVRKAEQAGKALRVHADAIQPIPASAYPTPAARPANSRLDCRKLCANFGLVLPPWQDSLDHILDHIL